MLGDQLHPPMVDDDAVWADGARGVEGARECTRTRVDGIREALRERHGVRLAPAVPDSDAAPAFHASLTIHPALSPS